MGKIIYTLLISLYFLPFSGFSQPSEWGAPIDGKILLSGTYGELRGDHYHGGLDIKPNLPGDQPVLAVESGYIHKILVRGGSYGNAIIIQHPDGFQSLYGHLDRFRKDIDSLVKVRQYEEKSFEVTLTPESALFPVSRGDMIAIMGNTGYSFGRHLHFEARNMEGVIFNPQLTIPKLKDQRAPQFRNLRINYYNMLGREYKDKSVSVKQLSPGRYSAGNLTLDALQYSLAVDVVDLHEETYNKNGIYKIQMYRNRRLVFEKQLDSLTSQDRKYYSQQIDYITEGNSGTIYYNLFERKISLVKEKTRNIQKDNHLLQAYPFQIDTFRITASDFQGNISQLEFTLTRTEEISVDYRDIYNYILKYDKSNKVVLDKYIVAFPEYAFLNHHRAFIFEEEEIRNGVAVPVIHLGENEFPLYEAATLQLKSSLSAEEKAKWTFAYCQNEKNSAIPTRREKDYFQADIRRMTSYCLVQDTVPPAISFQAVNRNKWHFKTEDNLHPFSSLKYTGTVDGQWALVKADDKNNLLIFDDFNYFGSGTHTFVLTIEDGCGNKSEFTQNFTR